jgi:hypothetical protein
MTKENQEKRTKQHLAVTHLGQDMMYPLPVIRIVTTVP